MSIIVLASIFQARLSIQSDRCFILRWCSQKERQELINTSSLFEPHTFHGIHVMTNSCVLGSCFFCCNLPKHHWGRLDKVVRYPISFCRFSMSSSSSSMSSSCIISSSSSFLACRAVFPWLLTLLGSIRPSSISIWAASIFPA